MQLWVCDALTHTRALPVKHKPASASALVRVPFEKDEAWRPRAALAGAALVCAAYSLFPTLKYINNNSGQPHVLGGGA